LNEPLQGIFQKARREKNEKGRKKKKFAKKRTVGRLEHILSTQR